MSKATPWLLFRELHAEFGFTVDVCAIAENAKLPRFWSPAEDGLAQSWAGEVCWCNPPYGRRIGAWVARAAEAARHEGATVAVLCPARTDVRWWHAHVWDGVRHQPRPGVQIRFLVGRVTFGDSRGRPAPFPTALVVFRPLATAAA